ncbi:MAG: AbrB family transcriptional regulator [Hormoscilla sp.]
MHIDGKYLISIWQKIRGLVEPLVLAVGAGFLSKWIGIPVAWLVAPLVVGIAYAFIQGSPKPIPKSAITVGKAIIGISSAARFSPDTLMLAKEYAVPLLLCILITGGLSMLNGYLLWKWTGLDRMTSFLGSIPGSSSNIVAMCEEFGADAMSVAVLQYYRMMFVVLFVPTIARFLSPTAAANTTATLLPTAVNEHPIPMYVNLLVLAACCGLGILLGKWLKLPTTGFLGSFLLGLLVFWSLPYSFHVPRWLFNIGLLLVGISVGLKFDDRAVRKLGKAVLLEVILVLVLMLCCVGIGYEFHLITKVDTMTALLGFVPGGIEAMIATVTELGGDTGMALSIQLTRQMLILLAINLLNVSINLTRGKMTEIGEES